MSLYALYELHTYCYYDLIYWKWFQPKCLLWYLYAYTYLFMLIFEVFNFCEVELFDVDLFNEQNKTFVLQLLGLVSVNVNCFRLTLSSFTTSLLVCCTLILYSRLMSLCHKDPLLRCFTAFYFLIRTISLSLFICKLSLPPWLVIPALGAHLTS